MRISDWSSDVCSSDLDWYSTTLFDRIFDDKLNRHTHYTLTTRSTGKAHKVKLCLPVPVPRAADWENVRAVDNMQAVFVVTSLSTANTYHIADLTCGLCTCANGMSGRICTHQVVAWQKFSESPFGVALPTPFFYPNCSPPATALTSY